MPNFNVRRLRLVSGDFQSHFRNHNLQKPPKKFPKNENSFEFFFRFYDFFVLPVIFYSKPIVLFA